jgi:hypothetical protein
LKGQLHKEEQERAVKSLEVLRRNIEIGESQLIA